MSQNKSFVPLLPTRLKKAVPAFRLALLIKDGFTLQGLIAIGAVAQVLLQGCVSIFGLSQIIAIVPALLVLGLGAADSLWQICYPESSESMRAILYGRTTTQIPDLMASFPDSIDKSFQGPASSAAAYFNGPDAGNPATQSLVVFHIGVRINHPLGWAAPGSTELGNAFMGIATSLSTREDAYERYGIMGMNQFRGTRHESNNDLLTIMYFRDVEGLYRLAHDPAHMNAWTWLTTHGGKHISAYHETFLVEPGAYETMYLNTAPTLLGAASVQRTNAKGEKEFVHTVVDANHPKMKTMMSRMGREPLEI